MQFTAIVAALVLAGCGGAEKVVGMVTPGPVSFAMKQAAKRFNTVKLRGHVRCGAPALRPGFHDRAADGTYHGFDVDLCRAVASAVFNDAGAVKFETVKTQRETDAETGTERTTGYSDVDILFWDTTWTTRHDNHWGDVVHPMFHDDQGLLVPADTAITAATQLAGRRVCVLRNSASAANLAAYAGVHQLALVAAEYDDRAAMYQAYRQRRCAAVTDAGVSLSAARARSANPHAHRILDDSLARLVAGPITPHGSNHWSDVVRIVMQVLVNAEYLGVDRANVERRRTAGGPAVRRLLGEEGDFGQKRLRLEPDFAANVIGAVGNYAEIYRRHFGPGTGRSGYSRGLNRLWSNGGLLNAPPLN